MRNRAGWLALSVLVAATALMVFFVLPRISDEQEPITQAAKNSAGDAAKQSDIMTETAQADERDREPATDATSAPQSAPSAGTSEQAAATAEPQAPDAAPPVTPAFDVLRVEPDGSMVIAGRADPGATVEVTNGEKVVATVTAGQSGDFALVLDQPLPAGDHQLLLKATGKDGQAVMSEETATVSVPAAANGKLLAMVTKPGKASRLVNVPAAGSDAAAPAAAAPGSPQDPSTLPAVPDASSDLAPAAPPIAAVAPNAPSPALAMPEVEVTAVEIEGRRLFIAGRAPSGASLLGFADEQPVGRAKATEEGNFVIEGNIDLSVGDHIIGVEMLDSTGKTALRVDVPFNRPAGEQVAAVAGLQGPEAVSPIDGGAFDKLRNEAARAFALLKGLYQDGRQPTAEELAAARSATAIALKSLSEYRLPAGANAPAHAIVDTAGQQAGEALAALDKLPREPEAVGSQLAGITSIIEQAVGPVIAESADTDVAVSPAPQAAEAGPKTIEQAPLTHTNHSVIIRRGDTLWQISRRVYGQGVRYTTIYLANQDQIDNPDLIEPGQIFGVPDEALPDAEEWHRKRLQKQQL